MIIICETRATEAQINAVQQKIREAGLVAHRSDGVEHTVIGVIGERCLPSGRRRFATQSGPWMIRKRMSPETPS